MVNTLLYKDVEREERLHILSNIVESSKHETVLARNTCIKFLVNTPSLSEQLFTQIKIKNNSYVKRRMIIMPKEVNVVQKLILLMTRNLSTPRDSFAFSVLCAKLLIQTCCVALEQRRSSKF